MTLLEDIKKHSKIVGNINTTGVSVPESSGGCQPKMQSEDFECHRIPDPALIPCIVDSGNFRPAEIKGGNRPIRTQVRVTGIHVSRPRLPPRHPNGRCDDHHESTGVDTADRVRQSHVLDYKYFPDDAPVFSTSRSHFYCCCDDVGYGSKKVLFSPCHSLSMAPRLLSSSRSCQQQWCLLSRTSCPSSELSFFCGFGNRNVNKISFLSESLRMCCGPRNINCFFY